MTTYLTTIAGTDSDSNPRLNLTELTEVLTRQFGEYIIKTDTGSYDIEDSDTDYAAYFDDAFGSGYAIKHGFDILLKTSGFLDRLSYISKSYSKTGTGRDQTTDDNRITDAGTLTRTDTPTQTVTITPSGNKVVQTTGSSSGNVENLQGAWNAAQYEGAEKDVTSSSGTSTETTTDGHVTTTTHAGKAEDISQTSGNTRTVDHDVDVQKTFSESGQEITNVNWTVDDLRTYLEMYAELDLYKWVAEQIVFDVCQTTISFYM